MGKGILILRKRDYDVLEDVGFVFIFFKVGR